MSRPIGKIYSKVYIKITSLIDRSPDDEILVGKIFLCDFVQHLGDGEYSAQVWLDGRAYVCTSCRVRFLNKEKNPEYFL